MSEQGITTQLSRTKMEIGNADGAETNIVQALSSSAATASTQNRPIVDNQGCTSDSVSVSYSEIDGFNNVPPPPPPLGIEAKFDLINISNSQHIHKRNDCDNLNVGSGYQQHKNSPRKTIFQKLHDLGLAASNNQTRGDTNNETDSNSSPDSTARKISTGCTDVAGNENKSQSTFTASHFATLRRIYSHRKQRKISGGSNDSYTGENDKNHYTLRNESSERLCSDAHLETINRKSICSISRQSLASDTDVNGRDYIYDERAKSESMSSLSSVGSTLSWFRKRNRISKGNSLLAHVVTFIFM